jgi:hypothetical protein
MQKSPFAYLSRVFTGVNEKDSGSQPIYRSLPVFLRHTAITGRIDGSPSAVSPSGFFPTDPLGVPDLIAAPDTVDFHHKISGFSRNNPVIMKGVSGDIIAPGNMVPSCRFRFRCAIKTSFTY